MNSNRKKFLGASFFVYLGGFYVGVNFLINDKLRADMDKIIEKGIKKDRLHEIHDLMAPNYEKKTENFEFRNQYNKYRRILYSYAKGKCLELGVGTGRSFEFYKDDVDLTAVDYSRKMLNIAQEKLEDREINRIPKNLKCEIKELDGEDIEKEFSENYFDSVVDFNNFHSYCNPNLVYNGIKKVLKLDGLLIFEARGESDYQIIKDFYKVFKPTFFMRRGQDITENWAKYFDNDDDWEVLYKNRKNYGRTYIYILKLKSKKNTDVLALLDKNNNKDRKYVLTDDTNKDSISADANKRI